LYGEPVQRERKFVGIDGLCKKNMGVYNSNVSAIVAALSERYFSCLVEGAFVPALKVASGAYDEAKAFRSAVVRSVRKMGLSVRTRGEVVAMYHGRKQRLYQKAKEYLDTHGLPYNAHHLSTFVKFEKMDTSKAPRIIQPRDYTYTLELARYLKHTEKAFYRAIAKQFGGPTVMKGYNCRDSGRLLREMWDDFSDPVAIGLDATKFDMHVTLEALKYEHGFYNELYHSHKLEKLLRRQEKNHGTAYAQDGYVKFLIDGTRSSGDINTALGNCLIMCSLVHTWLKRVGVRGRLANNGDDCVVIVERGDLIKFTGGLEHWFIAKGFRMKVETPVSTFERIEFCQSHPVKCSDGWRMVRNVATCLYKDAMCLMPVNSSKDIAMWLGAVGECGLSICKGVPVMESFYSMFDRAGKTPTIGFMERYTANSSYQERKIKTDARINSETRYSFYLAFGIEPDRQVDFETHFRSSCIDFHLYDKLNHIKQQSIEIVPNHDEFAEE